jgi:hypothetical protein
MIADWQLPNADCCWQLLIEFDVQGNDVQELMSRPFLLRDA